MKNSTDIVIHINESLDSKQREQFSNSVNNIQGVLSNDLKEKPCHLMIVKFNPSETKALDVLNSIKSDGVSAQLVAWL
ncbi:MAG: hypothetical protein V3U71_12335 [Cocleimonas sp.]